MADKTHAAFAFHYARLRAGQWPPRNRSEAFDGHVLASILAVALSEIDDCDICAGTGLDPAALCDLVERRFPGVHRDVFRIAAAGVPQPEEEELLLRQLLMAHRALPRGPVAALEGWLAVMIARRAMRPDHLWQDLGLENRGELNELLSRHFPRLHAGNTGNMRWKKYFYRTLCEEEGFALCTAPSCSVCCDFQSCFGDEDGISRMAGLRLRFEAA